MNLIIKWLKSHGSQSRSNFTIFSTFDKRKNKKPRSISDKEFVTISSNFIMFISPWYDMVLLKPLMITEVFPACFIDMILSNPIMVKQPNPRSSFCELHLKKEIVKDLKDYIGPSGSKFVFLKQPQDWCIFVAQLVFRSSWPWYIFFIPGGGF